MALAELTLGKSVRVGLAFRQGSCPDEKASASLPMPPAGPDRPPLTAAQGPLKSKAEPKARAAGAAHRKRCALNKAKHSLPGVTWQVVVGFCFCFCFCFCIGFGGCSTALRSPMARRVGGGKSPQGGRQGCRPAWRQGRRPCRQTSVTHPRTWRAQPGRRAIGVAFLLVTSLYSGHPALRPSGRLRRSRVLLHAGGHAKRSKPASGRRTEARGRRARSRPRQDRAKGAG